MKNAMRAQVALYARVSTEEQATEGTSIYQQPAIIRAALDKEYGPGNYDIVGEFSDPGLSGSLGPTDEDIRDGKLIRHKNHRPGLSSVFELVLQRKVDVVACINPSRLYRRNDTSTILERVFLKNNARLFFDHDQIDLSSPTGQMMAGVLGAVHSYQRTSNNALIKQMIGKRKDQGMATGQVPYGWRYATAAEKEAGITGIMPIPEQLEAVRMVKDLYLRGYSMEDVAREMNRLGIEFKPKKVDKHGRRRARWDGIRVQILLKNVVHAGYVIDSQGVHIRGLHYEHRAYDYEDYQRIQEQISTKRRRPFGPKSERPENSLIGIPKCASCGENLQYRYTEDYLTFRCNGFRLEGESRHVLVRADILEKAVLHEVAKIAQSDEAKREARLRIGQEVRKGNGDALRERATLEARKAKYDAQAEDALRQLREGVLSESMFGRQMASIKEDQESVETRLSELAIELSSVARIEDLERRALQALESFPTVWKHLVPCERTRLLETVLERLIVEDRGGHSVAKIKIRLLPETIVPLPRVKAPKGSRGRGGIESLTESEMAALWHLSQGHSPSQGAAYMNIARSTFSTFTARAAKRIGESDPNRAARRAKPWIDRIAHLLPLFAKSRISRGQRRPPVIHTTVRELNSGGVTAEEISAKIGIDLARVQAILDAC